MKKENIEIINYFKGISILGIILYHLITIYMSSIPKIVKYAANAGSAGVLIFFFCSGFGLFYSYDSEEIKFKFSEYIRFLIKRFKKIYIPYIIIIFCCFCIPLIDGGANRFIGLLSHIFQFRAFSKEYFEVFGGHFWYISTIFQLYIVFVPLYFFGKKYGEKVLLTVSFTITILYVVLIYLLKQENNAILIRLFPKYLFEFVFGMYVAKKYITGKIKIENKFLIICSVIGIGLFAISGKSALGRLINDIPEFLGVLSIFILLYNLNFLYTNSFVINISKISYELYLIHMPVMQILFKYSNGKLKYDLTIGISSLVISFILSYFYNKLIHYLYSIKINKTVKL